MLDSLPAEFWVDELNECFFKKIPGVARHSGEAASNYRVSGEYARSRVSGKCFSYFTFT